MTPVKLKVVQRISPHIQAQWCSEKAAQNSPSRKVWWFQHYIWLILLKECFPGITLKNGTGEIKEIRGHKQKSIMCENKASSVSPQVALMALQPTEANAAWTNSLIFCLFWKPKSARGTQGILLSAAREDKATFKNKEVPLIKIFYMTRWEFGKLQSITSF